MTVVNERSRVPPLDAAVLGLLSNALDREGVVAAMLIGSQARGDPGPLSDVDIGIWHDPGLDARGRFDLQLDLAGEITSLLGTDEVDLVLLNNAPPLMRHRAIREGKRLVERDHDERVRLETRAILDYLDTAPLRVELGRGVRRRMKEGRFGRRQSG
jgi:predicted nucleotidyltransferase